MDDLPIEEPLDEPGAAAARKEPWSPIAGLFGGAALVLALHLMVGVVLGGLGTLLQELAGNDSIIGIAMIWLFAIGLTQLIYVVPAMIVAWVTGYRELAKGMLLGAGITALLNGACFGVFCGGVL